MGDPWTIIGWAVIVCVCLAVAALAGLIATPFIVQGRQTRRRHRADAGKLKCDIEKCDKTATHVTPNGYFCLDHEGANSKKIISVGSVQYAHPLAHVINGKG
jgi:hypothetical protein